MESFPICISSEGSINRDIISELTNQLISERMLSRHVA